MELEQACETRVATDDLSLNGSELNLAELGSVTSVSP